MMAYSGELVQLSGLHEDKVDHRPWIWY